MSDAELMNEIARLAGAINRHKNAGDQSAQRGGIYKRGGGGRGRGRGRGRGGYHRGRGGVGAYQPSPYPHSQPANASSESSSGTVDLNGVAYESSRNSIVRTDSPGEAANQTQTLPPPKQPCPHFTKTGTCGRGMSCPFSHDNTHIAICKHYLVNKCNRPDCSLSHTPSPHNSPICQFFANGNCSNEDCKFTHAKVSTGKVCPKFAVEGYCESGIECELRHVFECPEFDSTGHCTRRGCKLKHVLRNNSHFVQETKPESGSSGKIDVDKLASGLFESDDDDEDDSVEGQLESHQHDDGGKEKEEESSEGEYDDEEIGQQDFIKL